MKRLFVTNEKGISARQMRAFLDGVADDAYFDVTMIGVDSGTRPVIGLSCDRVGGIRDKRIDIIWAAKMASGVLARAVPKTPIKKKQKLVAKPLV